jgi:hypothetical protein
MSDSDGSGHLCCYEFEELMKKLEVATDLQRKFIFRAMDLDLNKGISQKEFLAYLVTNWEKLAKGQLDEKIANELELVATPVSIYEALAFIMVHDSESLNIPRADGGRVPSLSDRGETLAQNTAFVNSFRDEGGPAELVKKLKARSVQEHTEGPLRGMITAADFGEVCKTMPKMCKSMNEIQINYLFRRLARGATAMDVLLLR